jgi:hypothetical protein
MKEKGVIDLQVGAYSYRYGSHDKWFCENLDNSLFCHCLSVVKSYVG